MKLHTGAFGTLGVIEAAWLRLRPRPDESVCLRAWLEEGEAGFAPGDEAARLLSARAVVLVDPALAGRIDRDGPERGRRLLVVELGGAPEEVRRDRAALEARLELAQAEPGALERVGALQETPEAERGLRLRVVVRPARMEAASAPLVRAGATLLAFPGAGLLFAGFPLFDGADELTVDAAWRAAREAARTGGGSFVLEAAPAWAKSGRDVFGEPPEALALMRAVKARFDPHGVLNPGRFVGGI
jgi:glycolate oxidase FAD binding subunit